MNSEAENKPTLTESTGSSKEWNNYQKYKKNYI